MALKAIQRTLQEQPVTGWVIGLNLWVLVCLYSDWFFRHFWHFPEMNWLLLPISIPTGLFNMFFLFTQFHLSVAIFSICLGSMILVSIWARPRLPVMLSFLLLLFAYAAWPLTVKEYEPAIEPAAGVKMQLVTDTGYFGSAIKKNLRRYEGDTCDYELLGWDESNMLYYESNCFGKKRWRYDPIIGQNLSVSDIPAGIQSGPRVSDTFNSGKKIAHPTGFENDGLNIYIDGSTYSQDGQWIAMESKHIYSVHDVVIFSKE